ncbi:MAG: hypothetical protein BAJALOKI2v1_1010009 [Promethearchaeota archaeon]|nr:MAG: hypothetical protein BAJALOKI2v1_1010009 [Candidatus Lokiarchaeota archaeon]
MILLNIIGFSCFNKNKSLELKSIKNIAKIIIRIFKKNAEIYGKRDYY